MTPRRRDTDHTTLLKWWPLIVALVAVVGWATRGVLQAEKADATNSIQWQRISDLEARVRVLEARD